MVRTRTPEVWPKWGVAVNFTTVLGSVPGFTYCTGGSLNCFMHLLKRLRDGGRDWGPDLDDFIALAESVLGGAAVEQQA
jgi:hypothetical protein